MWLKLRILFYYVVFRHLRRFSDRATLERWQDRRIAKHLARLGRESPYLAETLQAVPGGDWRKLPKMSKAVMMENFDRLNTVGIRKDEAYRVASRAEETRDFASMINGITVGLSSGTSGNRGIFLVSSRERAMHAGAMLAKVLPGSILEKWKVAFFLRANSNLYSSSESRRLSFEYFDLLDSIEAHIERLNAGRPDLVFGPPSLLRKLAERQRAGELRISPRKVISVAEVLDDHDARFIGEAFGQRVHQVYQATEGFIGITCREGTLHLNEDIIRVERDYLNPERTKFHPVITDFSRTSQPIVRYLLNDILTLRSEPCPCGSIFTALEGIEGRSDDVLEFFGSAGKTIEVYPDFIRRSLLFAGSDIVDYRVVQEEPGSLSIALRLEAGSDAESVKSRVTSAFRDLAVSLSFQNPRIHFHADFPDPGLKKLRRVERRRLK